MAKLEIPKFQRINTLMNLIINSAFFLFTEIDANRNTNKVKSYIAIISVDIT